MRPERILVPLDTARWPAEVFARVNAFAQRPGVTIILLHVVTLNIAPPERRIERELCRDAEWYLKRLAAKYVHSDATILAHVRTGSPAEEILAEAEAENADLIILPTFDNSRRRRRTPWSWLLAAIFPGVVEKLVRSARCPVLIVHAESSVNCEQLWGRPAAEIETALHYLQTTTGTPPLSPTATEWPLVAAQPVVAELAEPRAT